MVGRKDREKYRIAGILSRGKAVLPESVWGRSCAHDKGVLRKSRTQTITTPESFHAGAKRGRSPLFAETHILFRKTSRRIGYVAST